MSDIHSAVSDKCLVSIVRHVSYSSRICGTILLVGVIVDNMLELVTYVRHKLYMENAPVYLILCFHSCDKIDNYIKPR